MDADGPPNVDAPGARHGHDLRALLRRHFGFPGFRAGQEPLARAAVEGRDALGVLPTGGGKSVCYQLPAFVLRGVVLVVSPLISLMEDQLSRAREVGLRSELLNSTLGRAGAERVLRAAVRGDLDLLFLAPERFHVPAFRRALHRIRVSLLAVDEAHCISHWGHDFRPAYGVLGPVRDAVGAPVLALTATATPPVRREIEEQLRLRNPERVVLSFDRPNLRWGVLRTEGHGRRIAALHRLLVRRGGGAAVVYAATRRSVESVRRDLSRLGHRVRSYHAGLPPERRSAVQEAFLGGTAPVVVATNAFGMGVDKPDVRLVAHYQLPGSLEGYYQEAGRAGRDGEPAWCAALYHPRDLRIHRRFATTAHPPARRLRRVWRLLRARIGRGRRGTVPLRAVADRLGRAAGPREATAGLRALERTGALRLYSDPAEARTDARGGVGDRPGGTEDLTVDLGLHSPRPSLRLEDRLRRRALDRVRSVGRFARGRGCRRRSLLRYFGERDAPGRCGGCDRCCGSLFSPPRLR